ncbi:hypothetical protein QBC39DRAFT_342249 [Podospora conica]|nr:hypothetical protein QBC39DRAFT_342249 [Schizothecium conicum]
MPTVEVDDWRRLCLTVRFLGVPWNVEINNPYDLEDEANNRSGPWDDSHQGAIDSWQDPNDGEQGAIDSWQDPNDGEQGAIDSWQDPNSLQGAVDSWQDLNEGEQIYNVGWEVHWEFAPGDEWWETKKVETCEGKDDASSFASVDSDDDGAGAGGARRRDWVFKVVYALLVVEDVEDEDVLGEDASDVILGALKYVLATPERYGTRMVEVFSMAVEERMVLTDEQRRLVGLPVKDPEERKGKGKEKDPEEYGGHGEEARTQPFVWIPGEDGQRYIFAERFTSWMYQPTTALRTSTQR